MNANFAHMYVKLIQLLELRYSLTLSCPMDLSRYPHDRQACYLDMESCKEIDFAIVQI